MFTFREESDVAAFDEYVLGAGGTYLQTSMWARAKGNWEPLYYTGFEGVTRVLTCLVLVRRIPGCGRLWYAPYGPVCDCENRKLIESFTAFMQTELKRRRGMALIIDPRIAEKIDGAEQPEAARVREIFLACGYKANPDRTNYTYHPSFTIALPLEKDGVRLTPQGYLKSLKGGLPYSIRVGPKRGLVAERYTGEEVRKNDALMDDYMRVIGDTYERLGAYERSKAYFMRFIEGFGAYMDVDLIYYDKRADAELDRAQRVALEDLLGKRAAETRLPQQKRLDNEIADIEKKCAAYEERKEQAAAYSDAERFCVACAMTIRFGSLAYCLFGATANVMRNTLKASSHMNYLRICRSIETGATLHDFSNVFYEALDPSSPLHGSYLYKMSFGSSFYEFMGEYILVRRRFAYWLYSKAMLTAKRLWVKGMIRVKTLLKRG